MPFSSDGGVGDGDLAAAAADPYIPPPPPALPRGGDNAAIAASRAAGEGPCPSPSRDQDWPPEEPGTSTSIARASGLRGVTAPVAIAAAAADQGAGNRRGYQFHRPRSDMSAGTRTLRITNVSTSTARAE